MYSTPDQKTRELLEELFTSSDGIEWDVRSVARGDIAYIKLGRRIIHHIVPIIENIGGSRITCKELCRKELLRVYLRDNWKKKIHLASNPSKYEMISLINNDIRLETIEWR